ncbi:MAG: DUF4870 domain-containing protein [Actinomycetota bacterium]|nr:DUF4870 domain-containing protein [Actinomycetota bacterium]
MREDTLNYGLQRDYEPYRGPFPDLHLPRASIVSSEERTWAVLAHLSTFLNLFTGFLGPVAAGVIWLVYRDRSRMVASNALHSMLYQVVWLTAIAVGWTVAGALTAILVGFLLFPVMILVTIAPFVHASWAAYEAYKGGRSHHYI